MTDIGALVTQKRDWTWESQFCFHLPLAALPGWLSAQSSKGASVIPQGSHCRSAPHPEWPQVQ